MSCLLNYASIVLTCKKNHYLPSHSIPNRKKLNRRSDACSNRYFYRDQLEKDMITKPPCTDMELMDEVIGVNVESMSDRLDRHRARLKFIADVQFKFPLCPIAHERYGSNGK